MKQQECSAFLEEVLTAGKALSAPAAEHIQTCAECAALREMTEQLKVPVPEVPEALDRNILQYAREARRRRRVQQLLFRRVFPVFAAAAAAVVCVVALLPDEPEVRHTPMADVNLAAADAAKVWNMLESEAFDLNYELMSCQQTVADWQGMM